MILQLKLTLESDGTFGRGDGVTGLVDTEVEHDPETGLPFISGRAVKGLLVDECVNILYLLEKYILPGDEQAHAVFHRAAHFLFGRSGSTLDARAQMHVDEALLPEPLRRAVEQDILNRVYTAAEVLESLTSIRRQTAVDDATGAPSEGTLRAIRVVLRETPFVSLLHFDSDPTPDDLALLCACAQCVRRAGTNRNRGQGRLMTTLLDAYGYEFDVEPHLAHFQGLLEGAVG